MAEDGCFYDREYFTAYYESKLKQGDANPTSVITHEKIGPWFFPSKQHSNMIQTAIDKGMIPEDQAKVWKEKKQQKQQKQKKEKEKQKKMEELLKKADAGDFLALHHLGFNFENGVDGRSFPRNERNRCPTPILSLAELQSFL
ncbi:expressed unknown protein [Seminavis robusta]|uniref:Uncharacterized protein n=1 Tax=Seminavis robusta TaxID=568900 RepID=A0A9N8F2R2_9STRA|nr:expressed unknown protein [Seminavis robusta]|eukprot:Sro4045_g352650.1 n/a (143) ;mRNA; r:562-990